MSNVASLEDKRARSLNPHQWSCNFADGLLRARNDDIYVNDAPRSASITIGLPSLASLPLSEQLVSGHPLEDFIRKRDPLQSSDIYRLLQHQALDLSIVGFYSGAITAAAKRDPLDYSHGEAQDYSRNMWARDSIIAAVALNRAGFSDKASRIVEHLWKFAGSGEHRWKILQFHWGESAERRALFIEDNKGPHIKYTVDERGELSFCDHDWGHQQLDALGAMLWAPYRFANQAVLGFAAQSASVPFDLRKLDPHQSARDSILPATVKMFYGAGVHDTLDYGPWEDIRERRRATSVGIVVAALQEAKLFHEREGWDFLNVEYDGRQDGAAYRQQLEEVLANCLKTLRDRIPEYGFARECERRPFDSALTLLLYPFDSRLTIGQQHTILRTVYRNVGEAGIRRWETDSVDGPDRYVGQDFFYNGDPTDKGEFAKVGDGFHPAEWTLFDPLLSAYFYRRFIESGGSDYEAFRYGDKHLKRSLSFVTSQPHELHIVGKGRDYQIPAGVLPEAHAWDSSQKRWRPNHNSPLIMAQAALALAFERAREACRLADVRQAGCVSVW
jgi:hypothetical protein